MSAFVPTELYRKPLLARRDGADVIVVWYEGEPISTIYFPHTPGYDKWAALADEQARDDGHPLVA